MSDPLQEQLLGHLLGALEDAEEERIAARLRSDPALRRELSKVRVRLDLLEPGRYDFAPPPGLAERTCRAVASRADSPTTLERWPMSPAAESEGSRGRFSWIEVAAAAAVVVAAVLLIAPAIQSSRFNAQLAGCQDNLRQVGVGMNQYSLRHNGYFPSMTPSSRLAVAGIYAPMLTRGGFVTDGRRFLCPGSPLARSQGFRILSFDELQTVSQKKLDGLIHWMGGSYGYHLGHTRDGVYQGTRNLGRTHFGLAADTPGSDMSNGRQSLNHGGRGQNVLLEYGGVRFVTSPRPNPQADDIFANDWGLVAPGLHYDDSVIGPSSARPVIILIKR